MDCGALWAAYSRWRAPAVCGRITWPPTTTTRRIISRPSSASWGRRWPSSGRAPCWTWARTRATSARSRRAAGPKWWLWITTPWCWARCGGRGGGGSWAFCPPRGILRGPGRAGGDKLAILPLAVNLTRPSPGTGWRNQECASFLDRARGKFDAVLMLAVIHHMLVTERVPLADILDLAADLTTNLLVIEFVAPDDSMFQRLTRGREELHKDLTAELFETAAGRHFEIVRMQHVEGTSRRLYALRKRA